MIPGSNLLKMAFSIIAQQSLQYYQATGRTVNNIGQDIPTYAAPITIKTSFQPVARSVYEQYGLDFSKSYFTLYAPLDIIDIQRDVSADQVVFGTQRYQCESSNDWFPVDGWLGILCVLITGAAN